MQWLRLALRVQLLRHRAHHPRIEADLAEDGANFLDAERGLIEVQVNDVVVAIDLVTKPTDRFQLVIQSEDFVHISDPGGVNLDFEEPTLTVQEIRGIFRRLGLEARIVGPVPPELNPKSKTQPLRINP